MPFQLAEHMNACCLPVSIKTPMSASNSGPAQSRGPTPAIDPIAELNEGHPVQRSIGEDRGMGSSDILCPH